MLISDVKGVAMENPLFPLSAREYGLVAWAGQSSPFHVQGGGGGAEKSRGGGRAMGLLPAKSSNIFYIYI